MGEKQVDIIIIGAGLVGLSTAYEMKKSNPGKRVLILEKEANVAVHQSGHNSGVIHSGIYYKPGSLKAKNCLEGYRKLLSFADEHNIKHEICGKLIVATNWREEAMLHKIHERGIQNGLSGVKVLKSEEIADYEPYAVGTQALYVPQTGIIDYPQLAAKLLQLFLALGGEASFNEKVVTIKEVNNFVHLETTGGIYRASRLVSCGGLQSDYLTRLTNPSNDLRIIPFRGEYYEIKNEKRHLVKNLIYPVPDPQFPFLGVHFTRMISGGVEAGPNAVLAFKREGYHFSDFDKRDMYETLSWPGFWKVVAKYGKTGMGEIYRSLSKKAFVCALQKLIPSICEGDLIPGGAGVRAQACDRKGVLIDDFDVLTKGMIVHVRNAPSPAATSCLSIGHYINKQINLA